MMAFIESILGPYEPVTYLVYNAVTDSYDSVIGNGFSGVNWLYVITGLAFLVMLYSVFRLIGIFVEKL